MPLSLLNEALSSLCCSHGWCYGVLWRPLETDPRMLMMEECYYEEEVRVVVDQMRNQVHLAGEGTVGVAVSSGEHQWIYYDTCCTNPRLTSAGDMTGAGDSLDTSQGDADLRHQFLSGIKTIAIISLQHFGVVQFGSSKMISESMKFVNQVHEMLRQMETMTTVSHNLDTQRTMQPFDPHSVFASVISSGVAYSSHNNIRPSHGNMCHVQLSDAASLDDHITPANIKYYGGSMKSNVLPVQVFSYSTDTWYKKISSPPHMLEQKLLSELTMQGFPSISPTKPHMSFPLAGIQFVGSVIESCSPYGSQGDSSVENLLSKKMSFPPVLPNNLSTVPQDLACEHSQSLLSKDYPVLDIIHLGDQLLNHLDDGLSTPMNDNLVNRSCASSVLVGGDSASCSQVAQVPKKQLENTSKCATNPVDILSHWKTKSMIVPNLLQSDNDMFNGLELDLNPIIPRQDTWDDIVLPLVGGSCSSISTIVPECNDMGSCEAGDKGLFLESTLEELLDAVVSGNVSNHSSDLSPVNSVAGLSSELHSPKTSKASGSQLSRYQISLECPSHIRTSSIGYSLEKTRQSSFREISNSHTSTWINDSCSMNAESSVINQRKETTKAAKKRARPGESTRPRPKDRQLIQDRVKELREIVPNGAKCSIDSLLDRTIKHMLFLQSVTKHADKLRQADEPKMIGDKSGVMLKDHLSSVGGGTTWAYEVADHTMVCPLIVEDLNPPGQMLVEILCEDRGYFHEIADIIRGFGLTILKGVMEVHETKIWARFLVEANQEVTRMDIFLSLIQLLQ